MAGGFKVEVLGSAYIQAKFNRLEDVLDSKKLMSEIGTFIIAEIKLRTSKGKDADGKDFKPYSAQYVLFRSKKKAPVGKVDLFLTGSMMSSMTYKSTKKQTKVYFLDTEDKSGSNNPQKASALNKNRKFFALSEEDLREIKEIIQDYINFQLR